MEFSEGTRKDVSGEREGIYMLSMKHREREDSIFTIPRLTFCPAANLKYQQKTDPRSDGESERTYSEKDILLLKIIK